jgi:nicotinate-nucleotide adenylyltransferase
MVISDEGKTYNKGDVAKRPLRVGIAGGAFDPPHNGHLLLAQIALDSGAVDEVWFVPSGSRGDKSYRISTNDRLNLIRLLLRDGVPSCETRIKINEIEVENRSITGTVELFRELRKSEPMNTFWALIGDDLIKDLPLWRHPDDLKKEVSFLVVPRNEASFEQAPPGFSIVKLSSDIAVVTSSSLLRQRISSGRGLAGLTPGAVIDYINERNLYK